MYIRRQSPLKLGLWVVWAELGLFGRSLRCQLDNCFEGFLFTFTSWGTGGITRICHTQISFCLSSKNECDFPRFMVIPFQTNSSSKSCAFPRGFRRGRQVSAGSCRLFFLTFRDRKSSSVGEGLSLVDKGCRGRRRD